MHRVNVGIDVSPLRSVRTGIGYYVSNLLAALGQRDAVELFYYTGSSWTRTLDQEAIAPRPLPVRVLSRGLGLLGPAGAPLKYLFNQAHQRWSWRRYAELNLGVMHSTNYETYRIPVPEVVTVYDLSCFRLPETHPSARVDWQRRHLPETVARAAHILTISEFSKREIMDVFGIAADRITVTLCGVAPEFHPRPVDEVRPLVQPLGLEPGRYILTVGTIEPRKNLTTLIRAHGELPRNLRERFPLVIAGVRGWKTTGFEAVVRDHVADGTVRILGYVPEASLPALYAGAAAFAYPSRYEGFGLPAIEALASGVPSVVSDAASLPEVVGDAALQVAPDDVDGWRMALEQILGDAELRARLQLAGPQRARAFTWERTAGQTVAVYQQVARR